MKLAVTPFLFWFTPMIDNNATITWFYIRFTSIF